MIGFDQTVASLKALEKELLTRMHACLYYPEETFSRLPRNTFTKNCLTIDSALKHCGSHAHALFVDKFGYTVDQMKEIAPLLFDPNDPLNLTSEKRGYMHHEEATLLVCARFRHSMGKLQEIGMFFGRDPAAISAFTRAAILKIIDRFAHLLELDKMSRFSNHVARWNDAFNTKFRNNFGNDLRLRYSNVNVLTTLPGCAI